jgi:hypothetical protein
MVELMSGISRTIFKIRIRPTFYRRTNIVKLLSQHTISRRKFIKILLVSGAAIAGGSLLIYEIFKSSKNIQQPGGVSNSTGGSGGSSNSTGGSGMGGGSPPSSPKQWYNLRGVAYPWEPLILNPDQRGSPDPEWSYPIFHQYGQNMIRVDLISWGKYVLDKQTFMNNLARMVDQANKYGIWNMWEFTPNWNQMPADIRNAVPQSSWWGFWWNDSPYPGSDPNLQGLGIWEAWFKGFISPLMSYLDPQPCTLSYKFVNEPSGLPTNSLGVLAKYYGRMIQLSRLQGATKYLSYEGPGGHPGTDGLITQIQSNASPQNAKPAIYDEHYPAISNLQQDSQASEQLGVGFWDGEDRVSDVANTTFMSALKQYNCALTVYRWDKDGDLLVADGTGSGGTGTLTQTAINLFNLENQILGPAQFFT